MSQEKEAQLIEKIGRCQTIISEVGQGKAWGYLIEDFTRTKQTIDNNWHLVSDVTKLAELRVTKLAIKTIMDTLLTYQHDLDLAQRELETLRNPDKIVNKDWDTESSN